jgi:serine protease Do
MVSAMTFATAAALGSVLAVAAAQAPVAAQDITSPVRIEEFRTTVLGGGPQLGISIRDLEPADVSREGLDGLAGAYVEDVREGSPAADAGLKTGDVVTSFDGERVRSAAQLARLVRETPGGRSVDVTVQRNRSTVALTVTPEEGHAVGLGRDPASPPTAARVMPRLQNRLLEMMPRPAMTPRLGVQVQTVGDQLAEYFGADRGVLVTSVDDGSAAASAGLRAGDVITRVDGEQVENTAELRRRLADADQSVRIGIVRDKVEQTITATLPEHGHLRSAPLRRAIAIGL